MVAAGPSIRAPGFHILHSCTHAIEWIDEYSCIHAKVLWQALELQDEGDRVHPEKWYALNWKNRQTGNVRTESQILRYKRRHKEHPGGEASFASIQPAFWWRWYVCSYLKDRKKYKRERGETYRDRRWASQSLGSYTVWLVRCRAKQQSKVVKR